MRRPCGISSAPTSGRRNYIAPMRTNAGRRRDGIEVLYARDGLTNADLVALVRRGVALATETVRWDDRLPRDRAPRIVHAYLRKRIRYIGEGAEGQIVRLPSAVVKQGRADCKSFAVFAASFLKAAGYDVRLRFIKQRRPGWSHVYVIADGQVVDPCLTFGKEALYSAHRDYPV